MTNLFLDMQKIGPWRADYEIKKSVFFISKNAKSKSKRQHCNPTNAVHPSEDLRLFSQNIILTLKTINDLAMTILRYFPFFH